MGTRERERFQTHLAKEEERVWVSDEDDDNEEEEEEDMCRSEYLLLAAQGQFRDFTSFQLLLLLYLAINQAVCVNPIRTVRFKSKI